MSHQFIFKWFGLASFLFPIVFILLGIYLLFRVELISLKKVVGRSLIGIVTISLVLGFFTYNQSFPYGGLFGFQFNEWFNVYSNDLFCCNVKIEHFLALEIIQQNL